MPKSAWNELNSIAEEMRVLYGHWPAPLKKEHPWRAHALAMSSASCTRCHGGGLLWGQDGKSIRNHLSWNPCTCVLRAIFRACYNRYRECCEATGATGHVHLELLGQPHPPRRNGRPREEFCADFCLIAGRTLSALNLALFRLFFLHARPWYDCCQMLNLERGTVFHRIYLIQEQLGMAFHNCAPYALWPLHEYFKPARFTA